MSQSLCLPTFPAEPLRPKRSGLRWLSRSGDRVEALQPIAYCNVDFVPEHGAVAQKPFRDDARDLQIVLAVRTGGILRQRPGFSDLGGWLDLHGYWFKWESGLPIADLEGQEGESELLFYFAIGRRGFEPGEGRGGLLTGWHDRIRAFWPGDAAGPMRTFLSLGTCEHLPLIRGDGPAFADWFAAVEGPAQIVLHNDDRLVHSSPVLLQQLRRTPAQGRELLAVVQRELAARAAQANDEAFSSLLPDAQRASATRRNLLAHDLIFMQHLVGEAVSPSPLLEQLDVFTKQGHELAPPPALVFLSVVSERVPLLRHKQTGWLVAVHDFRVRELGPTARAWLHEAFEPVPRAIADIAASLTELAGELRQRTGAHLLVNNLISSTSWSRVPNYAWLGDQFAAHLFEAEANIMLDELAASGICAIVDFDAATAAHGGKHCPDRIHAGGPLPAAFRRDLFARLEQRGAPRWLRPSAPGVRLEQP